LRQEKVYRYGAVVCADRIASEIGVEILKNGGNAMDAACAAALALAVTFPEDGNLGGGGFALVYAVDSEQVYFLDFREKAPENIASDFYLDTAGNIDRDRIMNGPSATGVPGTVAGLFELHQRFGLISWKDIVQPARLLCSNGFIVGDYLAKSLADNEDRLSRFPATAEVFFPEGRSIKSGDRLYQPNLGATMMAIETYGRNGFYLGETAQKIVDYCTDYGGLITMEDLAGYQAAWREPVRFRFRNLDIYCAGLPSSGGIVMGQILGMLEPFELERYTANAPEYLHLFTEAARRAYADRSEYLGDPDFVDDLTKSLLEKNYILNRHKSIDVKHASSSSEILPGMPKKRSESDQTTHLVAADSAGNIVSLTYTMNSSYGSGAMVPGCGFILNNEMDDFVVKAGEFNQFGLTGGNANMIKPGKRMLSSMSPTIVFENNQPYLALGSSGGSKIITTVAQVIINRYVYKMPLAETVGFPRFHHQWQPDKIYAEKDGLDIDVIQDLIGRGHNIEERSQYGEVMVLGFSTGGSFISGVADPRSPGSVAGY
jgi:gamma-glutamyltranspeptidase/glutathione hydrolase